MKKYILVFTLLFEINLAYANDKITKVDCDKYKFDFKNITKIFFPKSFFSEVENNEKQLILEPNGYIIYKNKKIKINQILDSSCENVILNNDNKNLFPKDCYWVMSPYDYWIEKPECAEIEDYIQTTNNCGFICGKEGCYTFDNSYIELEYDKSINRQYGFYENNDICGYKNILNTSKGDL